ncbi:hypothetical protein TEA_002280 [Camellia sinensis var. sinensis]|uniref:Autophagy-related protein n=1 Tax=Camellia sinensis var. sinensis TaxID=542762 RepID=A0A4S4EQX5_CAMSN|nr:hypothetical protein TEA_002280 [Camellia sinensis var. sinensis]
MGKMRSFKQEFSFEERSEESRDMIAKYPDRVPVVVERYSNTDLPEIEKKKYLVPRDMSVGQFIHILSCRLRLAPGKALFVFVNSTLPQTSSLMESVYKTFKEEDGFLYMCYSSEKTFGCGCLLDQMPHEKTVKNKPNPTLLHKIIEMHQQSRI